ncbi:Kanadaptin [Dichanthelium oligosanthes]|uniref:Kanadaptin n=1 Tax=Dichanthelium oligosanthes TaxID=888268 RepID=A0A1E5WDQ3_9POAL|nr:Kanadaptin [Dichanthelium oligosanthes]
MDPSMPPPPPRNPNPSSTTSMPPPPPPPPNPTSASMPPPPPPPKLSPAPPLPEAKSEAAEVEGRASPTSSSSMPPPAPPKPASPEAEAAGAEGSAGPSPSVSDSSAGEAPNSNGASSGDTEMEEAAASPVERQKQQRPRAPYVIPESSAAPDHPFFLEVLKDGTIVDQLDVSKKGAYMFGRIDMCDFVLEHPTVSRFHAVLQFRNDGKVFLYDLGSTHGSFINKSQIKKKLYTEIHVGDVIRFGQSSRLYIFQGPSELMPPEKDMQKLRDARIQQDMVDREASILRAKTQAALAEGISWGMAEDAIEESAEDDADEITWQTCKVQLTERQEKTRSKIVKRMEKIANMKKEIDAIRVKDISQGGLTQGQQTQIARNEQRISQIMEELDNLEETLNDSIRESVGARSGAAKRDSHKASLEEDDVLSDDDEFFDRTKKKSSQKSNEQQSVETADSLLEKKDSITSDIENKKKLLEEEKHKLAQSSTADLGDDLDAYMSGLSSQLVHDKVAQIQKELSDLQTELDRVVYLLKIADPMGEAACKRDLKPREAKTPPSNDNPRPESKKQSKVVKTTAEEKPKDSSNETATSKPAKVETDVSKNQENRSKPAFSVPKPQWLGDKRIIEPEENFINEEKADAEEPDNFVDYKDRKVILSNSGSGNELEEAAPGLILRKRKSTDQSASSEVNSSSVESEASVADAVALLLKHKRGLQTSEEMENENEQHSSKREGKKSKQKRVLGPARPDFLEAGPDSETWVPPEGQTGDGRTALNDRLGY